MKLNDEIDLTKPYGLLVAINYLIYLIYGKMEKQDLAIIETLTNFIKETNKANYALGDKKEILDRYFNLINDE